MVDFRVEGFWGFGDFKKKFEQGDKQGKMPYIKDFPMETVIPMAGLFYVSQKEVNK